MQETCLIGTGAGGQGGGERGVPRNLISTLRPFNYRVSSEPRYEERGEPEEQHSVKSFRARICASESCLGFSCCLRYHPLFVLRSHLFSQQKVLVAVEDMAGGEAR